MNMQVTYSKNWPVRLFSNLFTNAKLIIVTKLLIRKTPYK